MIPQKEPLIHRRQIQYKDNLDFYHYDYPLKYSDEKWVDDDYMPWLSAKPKHMKDNPGFAIGFPMAISQIIPILKSMIISDGIKQGPKKTVRVHKDDVWRFEPS